MIWAFAAYIAHIIELLMITEVIRDMNPLIYMGLHYFFSGLFITIYSFYFKKEGQVFDKQKAGENKLLIYGYIAGPFFGNALWFCSLFLIGVGLTSFLLIFVRMIVTLYSYLYMNDRYALDKVFSFAVGIVLLMLFSFEAGQVNIWGVSAAVLSCLGFSLETICRKRLVENDVRPENMLLLRNLSLFVLSWVFIFMLYTFGFLGFESLQTLSSDSYGFIIFAALIGGVGMNLMSFYALKTVKLSFVESLGTTKPIILSICGVLFLGEALSLTQGVYGALIVASSIYFIIPFSFFKKPKI